MALAVDARWVLPEDAVAVPADGVPLGEPLLRMPGLHPAIVTAAAQARTATRGLAARAWRPARAA